MAYAEGTEVPVERSRAEIERVISALGAVEMGFMNGPGKAAFVFSAQGRQVRVVLNLPLPTDEAIAKKRTGKRTMGPRSPSEVQSALDKENRRRWRSLGLVLKARVVAIQDGVSTFEREFLADIVIPGDKRTVGEFMAPQLSKAYEGGKALLALPGL